VTIEFQVIGKHVRSVYPQFGGGTILADECKCRIDYRPQFTVTRSLTCPIDEHKQEAINQSSE